MSKSQDRLIEEFGDDAKQAWFGRQVVPVQVSTLCSLIDNQPTSKEISDSDILIKQVIDYLRKNN